MKNTSQASGKLFPFGETSPRPRAHFSTSRKPSARPRAHLPPLGKPKTRARAYFPGGKKPSASPRWYFPPKNRIYDSSCYFIFHAGYCGFTSLFLVLNQIMPANFGYGSFFFNYVAHHPSFSE